MKIVVGSDHAGFPMKAELLAFLKEGGHGVLDVGSFDPAPVDLNSGSSFRASCNRDEDDANLVRKSLRIVMSASASEAEVLSRLPYV